MSSAWYEYVEETGGEIIPLNSFRHVCRSLEGWVDNESVVDCGRTDIRFAYNYAGDLWWPVLIIDQLTEGWVRLEYYGIDAVAGESIWCDLRGDKKAIKSIKRCIEEKIIFQCPDNNKDVNELNIDAILADNSDKPEISLQYRGKGSNCVYESIKIGSYLECWLDNSVGFVWPVKVLSNIGGRLKLIWFGCDASGNNGAKAVNNGSSGGKTANNISSSSGNSNNNAFSMFYLDYRLHSLGWARLHAWKYSPPLNIGINISISNVDTFVRGSPSAFPMELGCDREIKEHFFEEGWQLEAVNPADPGRIHAATIRYVLDRRYFLVELEGGDGSGEPVMFAGFGGMAELLPANTSVVSGYPLVGLRGADWGDHLLQAGAGGAARYAPHLGYFRNGGGLDAQRESAFLPGGKLEATVPWSRNALHAATVVRAMEGSRLIWLRSDCDGDAPDWLVDPVTSTEIFPAGWGELVGHSVAFPSCYGTTAIPRGLDDPAIDPDDVAVFLRPQCFMGPFLSRSLAVEILPRVVGPGHCIPVFRALFLLLLKVSHKPYKLMRLLQLDSEHRNRDLMAVIRVPSPKTEWGGRTANKRADWLVEVAVRRRAVAAFCRQTALTLGACPSFITANSNQSATVQSNHRPWCEARLGAKVGEKMSAQRRKRLFLRPLTALGISYQELRSRDAGVISNSSGGSEADSSSDREDPPIPDIAAAVVADAVANDGDDATVAITSDTQRQTMATVSESRMCTRGMRLVVVADSRLRRQQRASKRRSTGVKVPPRESAAPLLTVDNPHEDNPHIDDDDVIHIGNGPNAAPFDPRLYVIDPTFLAGDIERVSLTTNPAHWTVEQVTEYLSGTDCRQLISWLANERVDGRAFLLLTLPVLNTLHGLQLELAIRLCRHVVSLKRLFVEQYADMQQLLPPEDDL